MEIKKIHFTSMDKKKYNDMDMDFEVIQNPSENLHYFTDLNKFTAIKDCTIWARQAMKGEKVVTGPIVEIDGKKYRFVEAKKVITKEMVDAGAMIITNPDGEEYFNKSKEDFDKRYKEAKNNGQADEYQTSDEPQSSYDIRQRLLSTVIYQTCGEPQSFYTATKNVVIMKPEWGKDSFQIVPEGSKVNVTNPEQPYSVTDVAFMATYRTLPVQNQEQSL